MASKAEAPPFKPTETFSKAYHPLQPFFENHTAWLALTGAAGIGKTATAVEVIGKLKKESNDQGIRIEELFGECPEPAGEVQVAYAPFQQALARHFHINLLAPSENQVKKMESALDGILDTIPFSNLLFPPMDDEKAAAATKEQIFISIARVIKNLGKKSGVVIFIDDVHWIDPASRELLQFLLNEFPLGSPIPVVFILTGRDKEIMSELGMEGVCLEVLPPDEEGRLKILVSSLGLSPGVAKYIVKRANFKGLERGELFWLFHIVSFLARKGAFQKLDDEFVWAAGIDTNDLPIPSEFKTAVEEQLREHPRYRSILECAACLGLEFSAEVIADSLERPRLEILEILEQIENETGLLIDVRETDDIYAFRSSFVLETIRKQRISGLGPKSEDVPQIIREYHRRLASSLEKTLELSHNKLFEVANHYYASGLARADEALKYCLKAAKASIAMYVPAEARRYLDMAVECAEVQGCDGEYDEEFLLIECEIAHIGGENLSETAEKCLDFLENNPWISVNTLISLARACYDAGAASRDQTLFAKAVEIGKKIIERGTPGIEKAEGYHFVGISLPVKPPDIRIKNLRKAVEELGSASKDAIQEQALLARLLNSLAEQLSYGSLEDKAEAKTIFNRSIQIKIRPDINDLPGLARSYGGLGRLALNDGMHSEAREYFLKDLSLSEEIGDMGGQSFMNSLLGKCLILEERHEEALGYYRRAFDLAQGTKNRYFAAAGYLEVLGTLGKKEEIDEFGNSLAALARDEQIPEDCVGVLIRALDLCSEHTPDAWLKELKFMVGDVRQ